MSTYEGKDRMLGRSGAHRDGEVCKTVHTILYIILIKDPLWASSNKWFLSLKKKKEKELPVEYPLKRKQLFWNSWPT